MSLSSFALKSFSTIHLLTAAARKVGDSFAASLQMSTNLGSYALLVKTSILMYKVKLMLF